MSANNSFPIDEATIRKVGLKPAEEPVSPTLMPEARVFKYPHLEDVYIMESDLYGNPMPEDSCFLAFKGRNGLIGEQLKLETLRKASVEEIKKIVENNSAG